jgi:hypothetical protein
MSKTKKKLYCRLSMRSSENFTVMLISVAMARTEVKINEEL